MRISYKISLLVSVALVLYLISSAIFFVLDQKTARYYDFFSTIKDFENGLLTTIIDEKDYSLRLDRKDADEVLAGNQKSSRLLNEIASHAANRSRDFQSLSVSLQEYRSMFEHLVKNNQEITSLKQHVNKSFDALMAQSDQAAGKVNTLMGVTLTQGGDVDPTLNSVLVAAKTIVSGASELVLTVDRDLLLDNNEKTYLDRSGKIAAGLSTESRNLTALVGTLKDDTGLKSYPDQISRLIPQMQSVSIKIHQLWQENRGLVVKLNAARDQIIAKDATVMASIKDGLQEIKHNGQMLNFSSLGLIFLVLITGGALIGRSITRAIRHVSEQLREGANRTAQAANQVSSASQQLAEGASEQAAAIEETSSSLEEMSSMTKQNANNASQANQLMTGTRETASKAGQSMEELTTSMGEISRASQETSKIIKTIDEIAFQTNLLALNAAVEAARAGEAGAGFAVVADEVRNLAMRAAEAAKNTAELIEGTVKKVKAGSELLEKTGREFSEVAVGVGRSSELIGEISAASLEQAQGIEQINKAVSEMDEVVQHSAANAEESASASSEMDGQARQMEEIVGELMSLVDGSRGNSSVGRNEAINKNASQRKSERSPARIAALPEQTTGGSVHRGNGNGLNHSHAGETRPAKLIPLDDGELSDF